MSRTPQPAFGAVVGVVAAGLLIVLVVAWSLRRKRPARQVPPPPEPAAPPSPALSIFISYRRDDSADITGRISDELVKKFGERAVFKDVDSIPPGVDFRIYIRNALAQCTRALVVIGRDWLETRSGERRLDEPEDHHRIEIEAALAREIPVIPVLVRGATMPPASALPESIRPLVYREAVQVRPDPDFHHDMDRLMRGIEPKLAAEARA